MGQPDIKCVLLDLDGTLADTAQDLAYALNQVLIENGRHALPFEQIRPVVSHGGVALLRLGFGLNETVNPGTAITDRFLQIYRTHLTFHTELFKGMEAVLKVLEKRSIPWGVVTNKPAWLTDPLMAELELDQRAACIISGDTTANMKPHPEPMLLASEQAGVDARRCLYVGDAERDIDAGRAAGMRTLTALFGYIEAHENPSDWGADGMIDHPHEILDWVH